MTGVNKQSNARDTKADEVCTNKCPNKKKHIHNRMIRSNAKLPEMMKLHRNFVVLGLHKFSGEVRFSVSPQLILSHAACKQDQ